MEEKKKYNILIVDDSKIARNKIKEMIKNSFDAVIFEGSNSIEALRLLGNHHIDLILLDVVMPEVDGIKTARIIKNQKNYANIPIIFITATNPDKELIDNSFVAGGIDFLIKPFTDAELVRLLHLYFRFIEREKSINQTLKDSNEILAKEIEERKRIESQLIQSEEKFRTITSAAHDSIFVLDENGKIIFWNNASQNTFGYEIDEAIGRYALDLLFDYKMKFPQNNDFLNFLGDEHKSGDVFRSIIKTKTKNNDIIDVEVSVSIELTPNEQFQTIIICRDITERIKTEQQMTKLNELLKDAQKVSHLGSWEYDLTTQAIYWSDELFNIYETDKEKGALSIDEQVAMLEIDAKTMLLSLINKAVIEGKPYRLEAKLNLKDKLKYIDARGFADRDENGKIFRLFGTAMDITERKLAEIQLEQFSHELKELNATKDKFFSIIAHDLRNPFGGLKNLSEILDNMYDELNEEDRKDIIGEIHHSSEFLYALLENLLTWSRSQRNIIEFNLDQVKPIQIVNNCYSLLKTNANEKNIQLKNEIADDLVINADPNMLTTVLRNLISNAIKFTPENGLVRVYNETSSDGVIINVRDTGIGMTKEDIDKLFRIEISHTTIGTSKEKGTGLGLILCKEFIDKHNGKIWVESKPNEGSIFKFLIPKL